MTECDVVVVGAGAAGLAAAATLRAAGKRAVVLEASGRIGGRAWTAYPPSLGGAWFDMGAMWLHAAEHNPLARIAAQAGETLLPADALRQERTFIGTRLATAQELAEYEAAWPRFAAKAEELLRTNAADLPLSAVASELTDDPWAPSVEHWEGPVISAADADAFSLRDWQANVLSGSNLIVEGGIGAFVQRRLGSGLDVRLNSPVRCVRWDGPVQVETDCGTLRAKICIVTVSTGVLAAGVIAFAPALPARIAECLAGLPMGLALKVALRANGTDRLDLPAHCSLDRRIERSGEPAMVFHCWPYGRDYVQGWLGGRAAWELARAGEQAVADFALAELEKMFGQRAGRLFARDSALLTRWDRDPWVRGAYSFARPGAAGARARLAEPLGGGQLIFAGEACHAGLAGTLGGAWKSGEKAARLALEEAE